MRHISTLAFTPILLFGSAQLLLACQAATSGVQAREERTEARAATEPLSEGVTVTLSIWHETQIGIAVNPAGDGTRGVTYSTNVDDDSDQAASYDEYPKDRGVVNVLRTAIQGSAGLTVKVLRERVGEAEVVDTIQSGGDKHGLLACINALEDRFNNPTFHYDSDSGPEIVECSDTVRQFRDEYVDGAPESAGVTVTLELWHATQTGITVNPTGHDGNFVTYSTPFDRSASYDEHPKNMGVATVLPAIRANAGLALKIRTTKGANAELVANVSGVGSLHGLEECVGALDERLDDQASDHDTDSGPEIPECSSAVANFRDSFLIVQAVQADQSE